MTEDCVNDTEDYQEIQSKTINPPYATKDDFISGKHSQNQREGEIFLLT